MNVTSILLALVQRLTSAPGGRSGEISLAGPTLGLQEPDLAKEAGLTERELSGWVTAGIGLFG